MENQCYISLRHIELGPKISSNFHKTNGIPMKNMGIPTFHKNPKLMRRGIPHKISKCKPGDMTDIRGVEVRGVSVLRGVRGPIWHLGPLFFFLKRKVIKKGISRQIFRYGYCSWSFVSLPERFEYN